MALFQEAQMAHITKTSLDEGPTSWSATRMRPSLFVFITLLLAGSALGCGGDLNVPVVPLPIADAGFDVSTTTGLAVTLDGSASTDPKEKPLSYVWNFVVRPEGSAATLDGQSQEKVSFSPDLEGTYIVSLVVSNGVLKSEADFVSVIAENQTIQVGAACGAQGCTVIHEQSAVLDGRLTFDPGSAYSYSWTQVTSNCSSVCPDIECSPSATPVTITDGNTSLAEFLAPNSRDEELVFRLEVADGFSTASACVAYTTTNTPPVITSASSNVSQIGEGGEFNLSVEAGDADADDLTVLWEQTGGTAVAIINNPDAKITKVTAPSLLADETLQFTVTVSDGLESVNDSLSVTIVNQ